MTRANRQTNPEFLAGRIEQAIALLQLDLDQRRVITEAATGPYVVTPVIAAASGARVVAFTRASKHGSLSEVREQTKRLAEQLGVASRIQVVDAVDAAQIAEADIVTNSGHLRPLDADWIRQMRPGAVIPLMYESWELRRDDVDIDACRTRGILVGGTSEAHPHVSVLDCLGSVVTKSLTDAGCDPVDKSCLLVCDNGWQPILAQHLRSAGARLTIVSRPSAASDGQWEIVVIAVLPPSAGGELLDLDAVHAQWYCQLWGDVARRPCHGVWLPPEPPAAGKMGLSLTIVGSDPIVRLQAAGLKTAELMLQGDDADLGDLVQPVVARSDYSSAARLNDC